MGASLARRQAPYQSIRAVVETDGDPAAGYLARTLLLAGTYRSCCGLRHGRKLANADASLSYFVDLRG